MITMTVNNMGGCHGSISLAFFTQERSGKTGSQLTRKHGAAAGFHS